MIYTRLLFTLLFLISLYSSIATESLEDGSCVEDIQNYCSEELGIHDGYERALAVSTCFQENFRELSETCQSDAIFLYKYEGLLPRNIISMFEDLTRGGKSRRHHNGKVKGIVDVPIACKFELFINGVDQTNTAEVIEYIATSPNVSKQCLSSYIVAPLHQCYADVTAYCSEEQDTRNIEKCMYEHKDELSENCLTSLKVTKEATVYFIKLSYVLNPKTYNDKSAYKSIKEKYFTSDEALKEYMDSIECRDCYYPMRRHHRKNKAWRKFMRFVKSPLGIAVVAASAILITSLTIFLIYKLCCKKNRSTNTNSDNYPAMAAINSAETNGPSYIPPVINEDLTMPRYEASNFGIRPSYGYAILDEQTNQ